MMMGVNWTYYGGNFAIYTNTESVKYNVIYQLQLN